MTADEIKRFMIRWNNRFPVDHWWRKKHNVPFLSALHKEQSFLHQLMEFEEERMFLELEEKGNDPVDTYIPNHGDIFKIPLLKEENSNRPITQDDIDSFREMAAEIEAYENGAGQNNQDNSGHRSSEEC